MTDALAWADHRLFERPDGAGTILFGAEEASLFSIDAETQRVLTRWSSGETVALEDAPLPEREVLEALREARILVPAQRRARAQRVDRDPAGSPLGTLVLEVAQACNLRCTYCYAGGGSYGGSVRLLDPEKARRAARHLVEASGERGSVTLVLFGGEPLLNLPAMRAAVEEAEASAARAGKTVQLSLTTNGTCFTPEVVRFLRDHRISVSVSIDGPPDVHDENRCYTSGGGTYADVVQGVALLRAETGRSPAARVTLTPAQWTRVPEVLDHLLGLGFSEVGIAPASPISSDLLPTPEQEDALFRGFSSLAQRFLEQAGERRILGFSNILDLLAKLHQGQVRDVPCGAGFGYVALDADGRFFLCHRLAGEEAFCIGDLDGGIDPSRTRSCLAAIAAPRKEACAACWARSLCAGGCHYENHLRESRLGLPAGSSCDFIRRWLELGIQVYAQLRGQPEGVLAFLERRAEA